jgi:MFS superfamily sulfate permease-like transporter
MSSETTDTSEPTPYRASLPPAGDDLHPFKNLRFDIPAGLVVFLVALPLCLGVALASGAPLLSGLLAGAIGGLLVPLISRAPLSVSGPAAGLAAVVATGITSLGSLSAFCTAVVIAGCIQLALGAMRAGVIVSFIPSAVIRGMLAAIGLLLILKQVPHAIGYDHENVASESFLVEGEGNTFSLLLHSIAGLEWGAMLISVASLAILIAFERIDTLRKLSFLPAALVVVLVGTVMHVVMRLAAPALALDPRHLVEIPTGGAPALLRELTFFDVRAFQRLDVWLMGLTLGVVASLESLLSLDAIDRLDPWKRRSDPNRELLAQGVANTVSGLLGGIPVTSVIVRSSANVNAGGRTRTATFVHGLLLLTAVLFLGPALNMIPLSALATILVVTGYKLAKPSLFKAMYKLGPSQFVPFVVTIGAILLTDLLRGILVGIVVGVAFTLRASMQGGFSVTRREDNAYVVRFEKDIYFFHKAALIQAFAELPKGALVIVDKGAADFIEYDVLEAIQDFRSVAPNRGVQVKMHNLPSIRPLGGH